MSRLAHSLHRLPLSAKINLALLLSTGIALSIAAVVHIAIEILDSRPRLEAEKQKLAQVVAANVSAAVAFQDTEAMQENLDAFALIPEVYAAQIRSMGTTVLAQYAGPGVDAFSLARRADLPGTFWIVTPITVRGERIGELELLIGLDAIDAAIRSYVIIALIALAISMLPAIATIRYFKPIILQPIHRLRGTIDQVTETQDYAARVHRSVDDEFGQLVDRFNAMLDEIERRDKRLARAAQDMAAARDFAEAANLTKTKFIANMSHELRTPLNAIIGYTEMVVEDLEDTDQTTQIADLNRILVAANHLLGLINDVLDVAKIEAGKLEVHLIPANVPTLIAEAVEAVGPMAAQNQNRLTATIAPEISGAYLDPTRFKQCLLNLLSNACKFTTEGEVNIDARIEDATMVIEVSDTGVGIAEEDQRQLFEPFMQVDTSMTRSQGGSGLGLAITRELLVAMGGEITLSSAPGEGSRFTITLPMRAELLPSPGLARMPLAEAREGSALVLVIEDSQDSALLLRRWLEPAGFHVVIAETGSEGIAQARRMTPDLIVLDIDLPDMTGWDVLETLTQGKTPVASAIIVLTVEEDRARALDGGAHELLTKPIQKSELIEMVDAHVNATPAQVTLIAVEESQRLLGQAIAGAGHSLIVQAPDPIQTEQIGTGDFVIVEGALLSSGAVSISLLDGPADPILWRPDEQVMADLRARLNCEIPVAQSRAELLVVINRAMQRETA